MPHHKCTIVWHAPLCPLPTNLVVFFVDIDSWCAISVMDTTWLIGPTPHPSNHFRPRLSPSLILIWLISRRETNTNTSSAQPSRSELHILTPRATLECLGPTSRSPHQQKKNQLCWPKVGARGHVKQLCTCGKPFATKVFVKGKSNSNWLLGGYLQISLCRMHLEKCNNNELTITTKICDTH